MLVPFCFIWRHIFFSLAKLWGRYWSFPLLIIVILKLYSGLLKASEEACNEL